MYVDMVGVMQAPSLQPLEKILEEVRRTAGVVSAVVAVPAAENALVGEAIPAEGAGAAAEVSLVDADLLVSLGDSLPLVGSWADYVMGSEEGLLAEAGSGGVKRQRASSGGEPIESLAKADRSEAMVQVHWRRKKRKEMGDGGRTKAEGAPLKGRRLVMSSAPSTWSQCHL